MEHKPADAFDLMISELLTDDDFAATVQEISDEAEMQKLFAGDHYGDPNGPYFTVPIDGDISKVWQAFRETLESSPATESDDIEGEYGDNLREAVGCAISNSKLVDLLDIIAVISPAQVISVSHDANMDYRHLDIGQGEKLVGTFAGFTVGYMPDELRLATEGALGDDELGVGMMLTYPNLITASGERKLEDQVGGMVIVPLGHNNPNFVKHFYECDTYYERPRDDYDG